MNLRHSVGEDEDLPPLVGRVVLEGLLEPLALLLVDGDLVGGVLGVPEDGGGESDEEGLVGDLADEVGAGLAVGAQEQVEVLGVGGELVDALEVVVAADDLVGDVERSQEVGGRLVADGGAGEELAGVGGVVVAVLGFSQVAEGAKGDVAVGLLGLAEDGQPLGPAGLVVLHLAGVDVQVAQHRDAELVGGHAQGRSRGRRRRRRRRYRHAATTTGDTAAGGDPGQSGEAEWPRTMADAMAIFIFSRNLSICRGGIPTSGFSSRLGLDWILLCLASMFE